MRRDRLKDVPSPLAVLRITGEPVRDEERFDRLWSGKEGNQGCFSLTIWSVSGHLPENVPCIQNWIFPIINGRQDDAPCHLSTGDIR